MLYDIAIVGYGPAGVTAAIYAARKKLNVVLFGTLPGGEVRNSGEIENWPGDGQTDGNTLADKFVQHVKLHADNVTIVPDTVTKISKEDNVFTSVTAGNQQYQSRTVIYTAGRHPRPLNVPGEVEYKGRGVTYCATCDAPLFPDKTVAVIGGGNSGIEAAIMLQKIAQEIYVIELSDKLLADKTLIDNVINDPKVHIILNAKVSKIEGSVLVEKLTYEDIKTNTPVAIDVEGVFVAIGATPNTDPIKDLVKLNRGAIETEQYGYTSVPGFFAAGDVTTTRDAQIIVAAGQGCSAALSAGDYLARLPK